ncbi:DeoR/GlpR family DNA-binding transcription regulator [Heyndrickxia acidicola]|uniref:DeoR/GlpR family DNA-binding transcription regulator n=1 Tax=Heyndrickxia acidicola TaxID=209389 RepID=A0ABU6MAV6_9BACI|nr:DeoR/GlpR family DNA-binding transcription regulator [Heyndrickxia acidicola]MED1201807.1 DeoR/GlpR family DNA-binding transcription regulator [Heyndrickxia acidicola]
MSQKQRLERVREWLAVHKEITLEGLMEEFEVSRDTARRDLVKLEEDGDVIRVKGGAILSKEVPQIKQYHKRDQTVAKEKIAQKASTFIQDFDFILFDTSTTVALTAKYMKTKEATVLTNSIDIVNILAERPEVKVYMAGGRFNAFNRNFVGFHTAEELEKYKADILFIGACGLGSNGLTTPDEEEAFVKKSMIKAARKVIVLTDHTKFHKDFFHRVCDLSVIDTVITDEWPDEEMQQLMRMHEIEHITIPNEGKREEDE